MKYYLYRSTPLIAFLVYGAGYALWSLGYQSLYKALLTAWGIIPFRFPFLDVYGVLAARECHERGIDVFVADPCDVLGRPHIYSPLWLIGHGAAAAGADTPVIGLLLDLAFFPTLWLLPQPRTGVAFVMTLAATLSTMTLYAVERANFDILILFIVIGAARLTTQRQWLRLFGYAAIFLAAVLKFYPAILLLTALRERPPVALLVWAGFAIGSAIFAAAYWKDLHFLFTHFPHGSPFSDLFAARNVPTGISQILAQPSGGDFILGALPLLSFIILLFMWVKIAQRTQGAIDVPDDFGDMSDADRQTFLSGLLLLVGCFFAGQSVGYRGVLFLLVVPGLLRMAETRQLYRSIALVTLFIMWEEAVRSAVYRIADHLSVTDDSLLVGTFWIGRELTWWWLMGAFGGILAAILLATPGIRDLRQWAGRRGIAS